MMKIDITIDSWEPPSHRQLSVFQILPYLVFIVVNRVYPVPVLLHYPTLAPTQSRSVWGEYSLI